MPRRKRLKTKMENFTYKIRTRYGETDQMGVIYYGNYALYLEVARIEWFRSLGLTYSEIEKQGIMLPVVSLNIEYKKPALYDQILSVNVSIRETPTSKITLDYQIYNQENELLVTATTVLVFVSKETFKSVKAPKFILDAIYR